MQKTIVLLMIFVLLFSSCQCPSNDSLYTSIIETQDDGTVSYKISNKDGKLLATETNLPKEPQISTVSDRVVKVSLQAGTGLYTKWTYYIDVISGEKSGYYYAVLGEYNDKVIYFKTSLTDSDAYIYIHNFFGGINNAQRILLPNVSEAAEPIVEFSVDEYGNACVVYIKGSEFSKTKLEFKIN